MTNPSGGGGCFLHVSHGSPLPILRAMAQEKEVRLTCMFVVGFLCKYKYHTKENCLELKLKLHVLRADELTTSQVRNPASLRLPSCFPSVSRSRTSCGRKLKKNVLTHER